MRVAFTHPQAGDLGGVERQAHSLAVALCDAGHEVHYLCERVGPGVDPRIRLHRLRRWVRPVKSLKVLLFDARVERAVRRMGPFDVVQGFGKTTRQDVYYDGSGCLADFQEYSLDARAPGWLRPWLRAGPYARAVARIERGRYTPGNFRRIVAISELVRTQILRRHGLEPGDVEVVHPGVDPERFRPAGPGEAERVHRELGLPAGAPLLVFLGSDFRRKGLATLLRALPELPGAHAAVIGRDGSPERWRRLAGELGVGARVHWLGVQPEPTRWLAAGACLVFPSQFDAFGSAVLEALACGLPALVSRRAGAAELVSGGRAGAVIADPDDPAALAGAVRPFLEPARGREASRAARSLALECGWDRHAARMLAIYRELVASGSGSLI